jgi:hypothetical protein
MVKADAPALKLMTWSALVSVISLVAFRLMLPAKFKVLPAPDVGATSQLAAEKLPFGVAPPFQVDWAWEIAAESRNKPIAIVVVKSDEESFFIIQLFQFLKVFTTAAFSGEPSHQPEIHLNK